MRLGIDASMDGTASMDFLPFAKALVQSNPSRLRESRNGVRLSGSSGLRKLIFSAAKLSTMSITMLRLLPTVAPSSSWSAGTKCESWSAGPSFVRMPSCAAVPLACRVWAVAPSGKFLIGVKTCSRAASVW